MQEANLEGSSKPAGANPSAAARAFRKVANLPRGKRSFRYAGPKIDVTDHGSSEINAAIDLMRRE